MAKKLVKDENNAKNKAREAVLKRRPQTRHLIPIKKKERLNPNGRPKGQKNYRTLMREAMISLAKKNGTDPDKMELEIFEMGIKKARLGDYKFYQDYMDRKHDKPVQKNINLDIEIQDEEIDQKANESVRRFMGLSTNTRKQRPNKD